MDIFIIAILVVAAVILFLVELFIIPGISIAGFLAGGCIIYANYYAFANLGATAGFITLAISIITCVGSLVWFMHSKTLDKIALKKNITSKVDRSAAYYSRYVAKNIVANGLARRCEVEVAYAIGKAQPVSLCVDTFGTGKFDDEKLLEIVKKNFNFEVGNIISELDLRKPVYHKTSCYGHFGDPQFTWEKVKKLEY